MPSMTMRMRVFSDVVSSCDCRWVEYTNNGGVNGYEKWVEEHIAGKRSIVAMLDFLATLSQDQIYAVYPNHPHDDSHFRLDQGGAVVVYRDAWKIER